MISVCYSKSCTLIDSTNYICCRADANQCSNYLYRWRWWRNYLRLLISQEMSKKRHKLLQSNLGYVCKEIIVTSIVNQQQCWHLQIKYLICMYLVYLTTDNYRTDLCSQMIILHSFSVSIWLIIRNIEHH